jgi:hypothetical protein
MATTAQPRFDIGTVIDGVEIIDTTDGRPVTTPFSNQTAALAAKTALNNAAANGARALRVALGALDPEDFDAE